MAIINQRMACQAIVTKYLGPANVRGARIKATASAGSVILSWDHALSTEGNHDAAAQALADKFGWEGDLARGGMPDGSGNVYVFTA